MLKGFLDTVKSKCKVEQDPCKIRCISTGIFIRNPAGEKLILNFLYINSYTDPTWS